MAKEFLHFQLLSIFSLGSQGKGVGPKTIFPRKRTSFSFTRLWSTLTGVYTLIINLLAFFIYFLRLMAMEILCLPYLQGRFDHSF